MISSYMLMRRDARALHFFGLPAAARKWRASVAAISVEPRSRCHINFGGRRGVHIRKIDDGQMALSAYDGAYASR